MREVFLSYAREDQQQALGLWYALKGAGLDVWFDKEALNAGEDWKLEIESAIREANIFIACLSRRSVAKRGFVQTELRRALDVLNQIPEREVFLIPVRLDECDVPLMLQHLHYVNAFEDGAIPRLVSSITNRLRGHVQFTAGNGPLRVAVARIDASDLNWAEVPLPAHSELFGIAYEQFFKLIEFVRSADLTFDVTLRNSSGEPVILSQIGIEIVHVAHVMYAYGFPTAAKVLVSDTYELEMPNLISELGGDHVPFDGIEPTELRREVLLSLPDPVYFEANAPYRFSLRLKHYQRHVPNTALLRIIAKSDHGDSKSHAIRTFTL